MPDNPLTRSRFRRRAELLLLAQEDAVSRGLVEALVADHAVRIVVSLASMRQSLAVHGADLVLLDAAALGDLDLPELCRQIRLTSAVAMIVLLASDDQAGRIQVLEAGADDSFCRALDTMEIKARITGLLRRAAFGAAALTSGTKLRFAGWSIDPGARLLTDPEGRNVDLTAAEFDLLLAFCRNGGKTLSRRTLLTLTRVGMAQPVERSIDVHISRLRSKIETDPHRPVLLKTVRLGGYVFTPVVDAELSPEHPDP
ncbi:MAG: response regulator transcription factor [Rhizobiaceae bacterium]|nr:response regulator transcription factor [Rhizobiaceae bacterium]